MGTRSMDGEGMSEVFLDYAERIEQLALRYEPRVLAILERLRRQLHEAGYETVEPYQMFDDNYRWAFATKNADGHVSDGSVDVTIEIAEQRDFDGEDANPGINFGLSITRYSGLILGGFQPYNYTPQVWVDAYDDAAVEQRFELFESFDAGGIVKLIETED